MSKHSHFPAVAGTLAGLLAAAWGAWYLYPQHVGPGSAPGRPAAVSTSAPAAVSSPTPTAAPRRQALTRDQAVAQLMALPELQAWAKHIDTASGGAVRGAVIPFDPALRTVNGKQYHQLSFVENRPDAAVTWESFLVGAADGDILIDADDAPLPLARWRSEQRPLERTAR